VAETHAQIREETLDPEREARRQIALAQLRRYPDAVLRMRAYDVEDFDDDLRRLAERMTTLMQEANGVGLAGNQVGVLRRIFVMQPDVEAEAITVVNPLIASRGGESESDLEGCLSLPNVLSPVERSCSLRLEGRDVSGAELQLDLKGLGARVAQHELDHLDGVLILDRTTPEARREALATLRPKLSLQH
jgi:peptide deformylase